MDLGGITSDTSSSGLSDSMEMQLKLSNAFKNTSSPFDMINHQKQGSQEWVRFDDVAQCDDKNSDPSDVFDTVTLPIPPDASAEKKSPSRNGTCSDSDLLLMPEDVLNHGQVISSPSLGHNGISKGEVPPIPIRRLSSQVTPTIPGESSVSKSFDICLLPPPSSSPSIPVNRSRVLNVVSFSNETNSNNLTSLTSLVRPPVPPRQSSSKFSSISSLDIIASPSLNNWVKFDEPKTSPDMQNVSDVDAANLSAHSQSSTNDIIPCTMSNIQTDNELTFQYNTVKDEAPLGESLWTITSSSLTAESPKFVSKRKDGYQNISSPSVSDEEETNKASSELRMVDVTIKVVDTSPVKPLSTWALIPNDVEDVCVSSGNVSAHSSLMGEPIQDDLDLDDVFGLDMNRLSAEIGGLKGCNCADKGSQNNLVNFSGSIEDFRGSSRSSIYCSSDDDVYLGTSPREDAFNGVTENNEFNSNLCSKQLVTGELFCFEGSDNVSHENVESSCLQKNEIDSIKSDFCTNPFWNSSPAGDSLSLTSAGSDPFYPVQFQTATAQRISAAESVKPTVEIPILPPPPSVVKGHGMFGKSKRIWNRSSSLSPSKNEIQMLKQNTEQKQQAECTVHIVSQDFEDEHTVDADDINLLNFNEQNCDESKVAVAVCDYDSLLYDAKPQTFDDVKDDFRQESNHIDLNASENVLTTFDNFFNLSQNNEKQASDIEVDQEMPMPFFTVDLQENSAESLSKTEEHSCIDDIQMKNDDGIIRKVPFVNQSNVIPGHTEWNLLMKYPRQKRVLGPRKWVNIYVRINFDKIRHPILQFYEDSSSPNPFYFIDLSKPDWQVTDPVVESRFQNGENTPDVEQGAKKRKVYTVKLQQLHFKEQHMFNNVYENCLARIPFNFKNSLKGKQLIKLGSEKYLDMVSFRMGICNATFGANRGVGSLEEKDGDIKQCKKFQQAIMHHLRDEIVIDIRDEFQALVTAGGEMESCNVAVHINVTSSLSGDPMATVTFNDVKVQGREVVKREDILPSSNDNWIEISDVAVHQCSKSGYDLASASIEFQPPGVYCFELARLLCTYQENVLPITIRASVSIEGTRVRLRCILRSSGDHSANRNQLTQVPCENLSIRFPLPDNWIPAFRRESVLRMKSVHAKRIVKRPPGPARAVGSDAVKNYAMLEASVGSAKYESAHDALVWRIPRFPEKNAALNTPRVLFCEVELASVRELPGDDVSVEVKEKFSRCEVEYTMPGTTASGACVRSIHLHGSTRGEKFTCYSAHYFYKVGITVTETPDDETNDDNHRCVIQ